MRTPSIFLMSMTLSAACGDHVCSAEVGLCDNEEAGDEAISICGIRHGWHRPDDCDPDYDCE